MSSQDQSISVFVKVDYAGMDAKELLQEPVTALIGVSEAIGDALASLSIHSVFDLATSRVFTTAKHINEIATPAAGNSNVVSQYGFVPSDWLNPDAPIQSIDSLQLADIGILNGINGNRESIVAATQVEKIRDLSLWPPFRSAQKILNSAFGIQEFAPDPQAPPELLPKGGEYATEKVYYSSIFLDEIDPESDLISIDEQVDVLSMDSAPGFQKPATGAILTFEQAWYTQGLALGQLLHSLALAPGESTRVAIIDWSRQQSSNLDEDTAQQEGLSNLMDQSRGISQVTNAVASETSSGSSTTSSSSSASNHSFGTSASVKANKGIISGGISANYAGNLSKASTSGHTVSSSHGMRNVSSDMSQNINQSTQQIASSVRTRRASVVREVRQSEKESITTRVVTNYNHSHALSVHYYEVVQIYRTVLRLAKAQRCVFVPMKPLDFSDERLITRYRQVLMAAAPDSAIQDQIANMSGEVRFRTEDFSYTKEINRNPNEKIASIYLSNNPLSVRSGSAANIIYYRHDYHARYREFSNIDVVGELRCEEVQIEMEDSEKRIIYVNQAINNPPAMGNIKKVSLMFRYNPNSVMLERLRSLDEYIFGEGSSHYFDEVNHQHKSERIDLEVRFRHGNSWYSVPISFDIDLSELTSFYEKSVTFLEKIPSTSGDDDIQATLNENATYYSQAIWQSLAPEELALLLSKYTFRGNRLLEYIDPVPLTIYGNYLVFPYHFDDASYTKAEMDAFSDEKKQDLQKWKAWKRKHVDFAKIEQSTVAIGTGGTFAEAVLGRFNASEKLDLTRFWNWQDSPIPIQAPNIEGIKPGSRAIADNTTSGQLAPPAINLINPSAMPDPNFAAIQALATANLFRDASGLSNVVGLAQDLGKSTSTASSTGAAAALKAAESALAPPPAPAKPGDTPKPGDASKPGESAKPPGGDASAAPASQAAQALKASEAGQAKLDNAVKLSSLPTNVSIAGAIINASLSLEAVAIAAQGGTPTPTTRERSGAVSEPTPTTRERSGAVSEPTPTTRERSGAVSEPTPTTRERSGAVSEPRPATPEPKPTKPTDPPKP